VQGRRAARGADGVFAALPLGEFSLEFHPFGAGPVVNLARP